jgi:hypothetical protein
LDYSITEIAITTHYAITASKPDVQKAFRARNLELAAFHAQLDVKQGLQVNNTNSTKQN